jgi:hypothetical protein
MILIPGSQNSSVRDIEFSGEGAVKTMETIGLGCRVCTCRSLSKRSVRKHRSTVGTRGGQFREIPTAHGCDTATPGCLTSRRSKVERIIFRCGICGSLTTMMWCKCIASSLFINFALRNFTYTNFYYMKLMVLLARHSNANSGSSFER